ncbi:MAG: methyltransferase domain-containing protein, partial [Planctomycetota bacterium]
GYLLHKNPFRAQTFRIPFGKVYVFYPEATAERCSVSLLLDLDLLNLIHGRPNIPKDSSLQSPYLRDISYRASTFLSIALTQVLGTAMIGQSRERESLAQTSIPLSAEIALIACEDETWLTRIFQPLGYTVTLQKQNIPEKFTLGSPIPSNYYTVRLEAQKKLSDLLLHLYVCLPIFDPEKYFWLKEYEINRILQRGEVWIKQHPERDFIYQSYQRKSSNSLSRAVSRILREDFLKKIDFSSSPSYCQDPECLQILIQYLKELRTKKVIDLNCGEGHLLKRLETENIFDEIVGMDISSEMLEKSRLLLNLNEQENPKIRLIHGSLMYQDKYLKGFDTMILMGAFSPEDPTRLHRLEKALFYYCQPEHLLLTALIQENTPRNDVSTSTTNAWTLSSFSEWTQQVAKQFSYTIRLIPLKKMSASNSIQMAIFHHQPSA